MDRKAANRQHSAGTVSFASQMSLAKKESERQDSLSAANNRDSSKTALLASSSQKSEIFIPPKPKEVAPLCRYHSRWRCLSYLQMIFGLLLFFVDLYSHYPLFSCGWVLSAGADWLYFGVWIGLLNFLCGIIGALARVPDLSASKHKCLRRAYFLMNCSFVPFANGIGLASYGITLSSVSLICQENRALLFTGVMAFISCIIISICLLLNVLGVFLQACATTKCKCYICEPKNRSVGAIRY